MLKSICLQKISIKSANTFVSDSNSNTKRRCSNVDVRLYTDSDDVKIDGETVAAKFKKGNKYYELKSTTPNDLTEKHTVTIDGTEYEFSPISYVYMVLHNPNASKKLTEWQRLSMSMLMLRNIII